MSYCHKRSIILKTHPSSPASVMKNKQTLFIDQWGNRFYSKTIKKLRSQINRGSSRVSKMYRDTKNGTIQVGYVIGKHWLTAYQPVELQIHHKQ